MQTQDVELVTTSLYGSGRVYLSTVSTCNAALESLSSNFPYYMQFLRGATSGITDNMYTLNFRMSSLHVNALNWGTATPAVSNLTLSFWTKSSITGNHWFVLGNSNQIYFSTQAYYSTFNIPSANTWTFVSNTIPYPTTASKWGALSIAFHHYGQINTTTNVPAAGSITNSNTWVSSLAFKTQSPSSSANLAAIYNSATNNFNIAAPMLVMGSTAGSFPPYYLQRMQMQFTNRNMYV